MITSKPGLDGRTEFGVLGPNNLVRLLDSKYGWNPKRGDLIDVFGGTIQMVSEILDERGKHIVTTTTANDSGQFEIITYTLQDEQLVGCSKRVADMSAPRDIAYSEEYSKALGLNEVLA